MVNDHEIKQYKNIEIPAEIKRLEYCGFRFDVPEDGRAITFNIWFNEGILPEIWSAERERQHRAKKEDEVETPVTIQQKYAVTGESRKAMVQAIGEITGEKPGYLGMPSQAYEIGKYSVSKDRMLRGPDCNNLIQ